MFVTQELKHTKTNLGMKQKKRRQFLISEEMDIFRVFFSIFQEGRDILCVYYSFHSKKLSHKLTKNKA